MSWNNCTLDQLLHSTLQFNCRRVYLTPPAQARLGSMVGYFAALNDSNPGLGNCLWDDFKRRLFDCIACDNTIEQLQGKTLNRKIPSNKVLLYDDGSLNSFSFTMFHPRLVTQGANYSALLDDSLAWEIVSAEWVPEIGNVHYYSGIHGGLLYNGHNMSVKDIADHYEKSSRTGAYSSMWGIHT